jgi:hypothetical protein
MTLLTLGVLYFVPKIDLFGIPGFTIQSKPEDIVWLLTLPLLAFRSPSLAGPIRKAWALVLGYVLLSALIHPGNVVLAVRFFFYSIPLFYILWFAPPDLATIRRLSRAFLALMAVVSVLQVYTPFPYLHTGELGIGPIDRASGIYGNGVELALMALFAFWLLLIAGERRLWPLLAALVIAWCTGTRMVMAMLLLSGLVYLLIWPMIWRVLFLGAATLALLGGGALIATQEDSRLADINPGDLVSTLSLVLDGVEGATSTPSNQEGYCFEFDDTLAEDQSFAMRLSKLLFVTETVVLGVDPLGFGVGRCIGDAGDNLYVRVLSDAGLPYLAVLLIFFATLFLSRPSKETGALEWRLFVIVLMAVSLFYDSIYFSRVAPLIFLCIAIEASRRGRGAVRLQAAPPRTGAPAGAVAG